MERMSLLVVGSTAFDTVETPSGTARDCLGGSSVYCALAARMFTKVRLVSVVGQDFPAEHRRLLQQHGIDLSGLESKPGKTFRWHGRYSADMNTRTTIDVQLNTFGDFRPVVPAAFQDTRFVFLANGAPATQMSVLQQMRAPELVVADTMDLWIEREREGLLALLRKVHGVILNDAEVRQLTGESNLIRAGRKVLELGPTLAIVKKGEHGCFVFSRSLHYALPAYPTAQVVDPTGAGDSFAGGFMGYLAGAGSIDAGALKRAVAYGTVTASLTVEGFGVERLAATDRATVDKRFQDLLEFVTP
jgi:sugar/nucleoside kinase (ribokinase family)